MGNAWVGILGIGMMLASNKYNNFFGLVMSSMPWVHIIGATVCGGCDSEVVRVNCVVAGKQLMRFVMFFHCYLRSSSMKIKIWLSVLCYGTNAFVLFIKTDN